MSTPKPHLSPTQLDMFTRCGEQYRRRYIEGEILLPGVAILKGKTFHRGAEFNMRQKLVSHEDLPANELQEFVASAWQEETMGGYALSDEEQFRGHKAVLAEAKDATVEMAGVHAAQQAPNYQPVLVEQRIRIELPMCSHDLLGVIDLADDKDRVIDFKTAGKRKSQSDADSSVQLTTYHAAFAAHTGRSPSELRLDTLVSGKKGVSRDVVTTQRAERDFDVLAARINVVSAAIQAGVFVPATPGSWWCSTKFCGFALTCPYFNAERRQGAAEE